MPVSSISRKNIKLSQNGFQIRQNRLGILKISLQNYALSMQNQVLVIFFAGTPLSHAEAVLKVRVTRNARNPQKSPNVGVFTKFLTVFVYAKTEKRAIQKLSSLPSSFELRVICCKKIVSSSL